jgi:outer membrane protein TolC
MKPIWIPFFMGLSLASCTHWTNASHPENLAPKDAEAIYVLPKRAQKAIADESVFSELPELSDGNYSLAEVISLGLKYNTRTRTSWAQALNASALYGQSLQNDFVLSEFQEIYTREKQPLQTFGLSELTTPNVYFQTILQSQLQLNYTFLDFGQTENQSLKTLYTLFEADLSHNQMIQTVLRDIVADYYNLIYQKELLRSGEADVENALLALEAAEERLRTGMGDISDVVQAKTNALSYQLTVVNQKQSLLSTKVTLLNDMGIPGDINIEPVSFPDKISQFYQKDYSSLIDMAKRLRPEYLASCSKLKSSEYALKAAKAMYYPTATGMLEFGNTTGNNGLKDDYDFTLTVNVTLPLFQGFYQRNVVKAAAAQILAAKAAVEESALEITKDVKLYKESIDYAIEAITYSQEYLASAKEDFRVYLDKYRTGTTTILDLIDAQTHVSDASAKLILSKKDYYLSVAELAYATGSLNPNISGVSP